MRKARSDFEKAYKAFPIYHSVDEIYHRVLTVDLVTRYSAAPPPQKKLLVRRIAEQILANYGWGIPNDLRSALQKLTA